jgi:hypothetical protein
MSKIPGKSNARKIREEPLGGRIFSAPDPELLCSVLIVTVKPRDPLAKLNCPGNNEQDAYSTVCMGVQINVTIPVNVPVGATSSENVA